MWIIKCTVRTEAMEAVIKLLMEIVEEIHIGLKAAGVLAALEIFFGLKLGGSSPVSAYYQ